MISIETKRSICKEVCINFVNTNINIGESIDIFEKFVKVEVPTTEEDISGIETRLINPINIVFNLNSTRNDIILSYPAYSQLEPFLKKVLYFIDVQKYIACKKDPIRGLIKYINALGLNPLDKNLSPVDLSIYKNDKKIMHLSRAYLSRNVDAHQCKGWSSSELFENINSIMTVFLYVTIKYKNLLIEIINKDKMLREINCDDYLKGITCNFKQRLSRFIHLSSEEDIKISQGIVVETVEDDNESAVVRSGTVAELRKKEMPERRMMLWGDAGTGKSTTIEYLSYIDAQKHLKNPIEPIPVLISMGLLTDECTTIMNSICNKLNVSISLLKIVLNSGFINLFFDGINETPQNLNNTLKTARLREIQEIISTYPKTFIILSNRAQEGREFASVPVFQILKMSHEQVNLFLEKNTDNLSIKKIILEALKSDERLLSIVKTPLMLSRLIEIVKITGTVPKSEGKIIGEFLKCLLNREKNEKHDARLDVKKVEYLLRTLAYESLEQKGGNVGLTEEYVLECFIKTRNTYKFEVDTMYVMYICLDLGILEKRDDLYQFSHQSYQDYYYAQEEMAVLGYC